MKDYKFLEDDTISLIIMSEKDFHLVFPVMNSPHVLDSMVYNYPLDKDESYELFKNSPGAAACGENFSYIISIKQPFTIAGMCGLFDVHKERKKAELGYWITPGQRRRGIAFAACSLVIDCAFSRLRLHKVWAETFASNFASQQLLEKLKFRQIGIQEKEVFKHGHWVDRIQYELLNPSGD